MLRSGVDVYVNAKFKPFPGTDEWAVLDDEERSIFDKPFKVQKIGIVETTPDNFFVNKSKIKICNTMAETNQIGPEWVNEINKMDYVIVPNVFYRDVFMDSGVTSPITVIPHGVDVEKYPYFKRKKPKVFKFGSCGYLNERKGVFEMITAFASEFGPDDKVELHLHSTDPDLYFYKNIKDKRIKITRDLWDFETLNKWYQSIDCFVFPSRAEGIGYPPREAMSTGLPTILMNYSGLEDICDSSFNYPLEPAGFEQVNPMREQPGDWAKIDVPQLMYWMRYVYSHKEEAYDKGKIASRVIYEQHRWEISAKRLKLFLEKIDEMSSMSKK